MFYAPWCAHSVDARKEFLKAARYLENEVSSVVLNLDEEIIFLRFRNMLNLGNFASMMEVKLSTWQLVLKN